MIGTLTHTQSYKIFNNSHLMPDGSIISLELLDANKSHNKKWGCLKSWAAPFVFKEDVIQ
jgi:hypothetical protein